MENWIEEKIQGFTDRWFTENGFQREDIPDLAREMIEYYALSVKEAYQKGREDQAKEDAHTIFVNYGSEVDYKTLMED